MRVSASNTARPVFVRGNVSGASRPAFTLIELLVVIAIISMLLSILTPALRQAKLAARRAQCLARTNQLAVGVVQFTVNHNSRTPPNTAWYVWLPPYVGKHQVINYCPEVTVRSPLALSATLFMGGTHYAWGWGGPDPADPQESLYRGSYCFNCWLSQYDGNGWFPIFDPQRIYAYDNTGQIASPSRTPIIGDGCWAEGWPLDTDLPPDNADFPWISDYNDLRRWCMPRHDNGVNLAFVDGSARYVERTHLWALTWNRRWTTQDYVEVSP